MVHNIRELVLIYEYKIRKNNPYFYQKRGMPLKPFSIMNTKHNILYESWNNRFKHLVGNSHLTIWVLIRKIKLEVGADRAKTALSNMGQKNQNKS